MKWCILLAVVSLPVIAVVASTIRSGGGAVQPDELARLIDRADKLVVLQGPWDGSAVLFESSDRRDLDALKSSLRVERPEQDLHCMCDGTPAIFLYANGEKVGQLTNHHGELIRCSLWRSDARLVDAEAFLRWFDDRKLPGPRKEYEAGLEQYRKSQDYERKWVEAMPTALQPLWPAARRSFDPDLTPLRKALAEQLPAKNDRILALFTWYGSGAGPWSGYPSYEDVAENMLLDYSSAELLAVVEGRKLTEAQTEGAARLFGGWTFSQRRPNDRRLLPAGLKASLLEHSLAGADGDKRGRALSAFGGE
jgi:hypothetical protein